MKLKKSDFKMNIRNGVIFGKGKNVLAHIFVDKKGVLQILSKTGKINIWKL